MTKLKMFTSDNILELEQKINHWLQGDHTIHDIRLSETSDSWTIAITYDVKHGDYA